MRIVSIEPTPSPHSMKLNVDERLPDGVRNTYSPDKQMNAPDYVKRLLAIPGVAGLYRVADFIALDRTPSGDWQSILAAARDVLGGGEGSNAQNQFAALDETSGYGEVKVLVQTFRHIPMQVRVRSGAEEQRSALPERFSQAAMKAGLASPNLLAERRLEERGVRYGELAEVLAEVVRELDAAYDEARLTEMVDAAIRMSPTDVDAAGGGATPELRGEMGIAEAAAAMQSADWRTRYAALQRLKPSPEAIPLLAEALHDPQMSIRRLATVFLGDTKEPAALPHLFRALKDQAVAVRRTAGDTLSDLGDPSAIPEMIRALRDSSRLVRWRAARFLYEQGDESALPALHAAADDPEFEVRMQIKLAIERIEGGEAAAGSVWQQMTNRARD